MSTTKSLAESLGSKIGVIAVHDGAVIVTLNTGETSYGSDGGALAFAYRAGDVARFLRGSSTECYDDFCHAMRTVETRRLAWRLARRGWRLTHAGSCAPVLSDVEYESAQ